MPEVTSNGKKTPSVLLQNIMDPDEMLIKFKENPL
jgi:hypothetical protein